VTCEHIITIRYPLLSPSTFLTNASIIVIVIDGTSKQNDSATATSADVQLKVETSDYVTNVTGYFLYFIYYY